MLTSYYFAYIQIILAHMPLVLLIISYKIISNDKSTNTIIKTNNNNIGLSYRKDNSEYK
jgi:hypothetical protein